MKTCLILRREVALIACMLAGCSTPPTRPPFPEASILPPQAALPDPLVLLDGRRVTSREQWLHERRPELQALFQHYMYGAIPPRPAAIRARMLGEHRDFLGGKATLRLVTLEFGDLTA